MAGASWPAVWCKATAAKLATLPPPDDRPREQQSQIGLFDWRARTTACLRRLAGPLKFALGLRSSRRRRRCFRRPVRVARAKLAQEGVKRAGCGDLLGNAVKLAATGSERRGDDLEGAPIGSIRHLGRVFLAEAIEPDRVLGKRIGDRPAQDISTFGISEWRKVAPAFPIFPFNLFACLLPAMRRPQNIGAQALHVAAFESG